MVQGDSAITYPPPFQSKPGRKWPETSHPSTPKNPVIMPQEQGQLVHASPLQKPLLYFPLPLCRWLETVLCSLIHGWWVEANTETREAKALWNWSPWRKGKIFFFFLHIRWSTLTELVVYYVFNSVCKSDCFKNGRRGENGDTCFCDFHADCSPGVKETGATYWTVS